MKQKIHSTHVIHPKTKKPAGGTTSAVGLRVNWQNGPLGRGKERVPPNGCFVETLLDAAKDRLEFYQSGDFKCKENEAAIKAIDKALASLDARTKDREKREVEGTHKK